jgi:cbb3-type cytochrome oxidase maturation protein
MESLYILIPIALLLAGGAIAAFLWAVHSRQFEDLEMEGKRLLFDDEPATLRADKPLPPSAASDSCNTREHANE